MLAAVAAGLKVILCVGEMKDVREAGATDGLVDYQTIMALNGLTAEQVGGCRYRLRTRLGDWHRSDRDRRAGKRDHRRHPQGGCPQVWSGMR